MNIILWALILIAWAAAMTMAYLIAVKAYRFAKGPPPIPANVPRALVVHLSLGGRLDARAAAKEDREYRRMWDDHIKLINAIEDLTR